MAAPTAAAVAAAAPRATVHPPASPFAELLRRSRFASFDPAIRQTYTSPPAHVHRGDWGLKRPIAARRKNQFITLSSFEHRAHFVEWNRAEDEVRFIRRIDEMDVLPRTTQSTPWYKGLGKASQEWLLDSEFCPEDMQDAQAKKQQEHLLQTEPQQTVNLAEMGKQGPGAYGSRRPLPPSSSPDKPDSRVMPNINGMSSQQFKRYIRHLRSLRPAFKDWIENHRDKPRIASKSLYDLSQRPDSGLHRLFIQEHLTTELQDPTTTKFETNPHRNAALNYAHPTPLDTLYRTKPQPGFVLNTLETRERSTHNALSNRAYVASFGGLTTTLNAKHAMKKLPLLDPNSEMGIDKNRINDSIAQFRLLNNRGFVLDAPPRVVGKNPDTLDSVRIDAKVIVVDGEPAGLPGDNPHPLGSPDYVSARPARSKPAPRGVTKASSSSVMKLMNPARPSKEDKSAELLKTLGTLMPGRKSGEKPSGKEEKL